MFVNTPLETSKYYKYVFVLNFRSNVAQSALVLTSHLHRIQSLKWSVPLIDQIRSSQDGCVTCKGSPCPPGQSAATHVAPRSLSVGRESPCLRPAFLVSVLRPWRLCVRLETVTEIPRPVSGGSGLSNLGPK